MAPIQHLPTFLTLAFVVASAGACRRTTSSGTDEGETTTTDSSEASTESGEGTGEEDGAGFLDFSTPETTGEPCSESMDCPGNLVCHPTLGCTEAWSGLTYRVTPYLFVGGTCFQPDANAVLRYEDSLGDQQFETPERTCGGSDLFAQDSWELTVEPMGDLPGPGCGNVSVAVTLVDPPGADAGGGAAPWPGTLNGSCGYPPREWLHEGFGELTLSNQNIFHFSFEVLE